MGAVQGEIALGEARKGLECHRFYLLAVLHPFLRIYEPSWCQTGFPQFVEKACFRPTFFIEFFFTDTCFGVLYVVNLSLLSTASHSNACFGVLKRVLYYMVEHIFLTGRFK